MMSCELDVIDRDIEGARGYKINCPKQKAMIE